MADKPRAKARRAAALTRPVVLKKDFQNEMSAADRIRYYLGLPQGYPMNPVLIEKASVRLIGEQNARGRLTPFEGQVMDDVFSAAEARRQDERSYERHPEVAERFRARAKKSLLEMAADEEGRYSPMWNAQYALSRLYGELPSEYGGDRYGPDVFPSQEAAEAHLQRSGFRDPGETVSQARAKARQDAAKRPQNPRMGPVKRKHGGGY